MAGLIRKEDIDEVRARTDIREIIEGYVSLKSAGIGTFKGLCPFHDERTPSFNVRPQYDRAGQSPQHRHRAQSWRIPRT